jgi:hypothetical protein
MFIVTRALRTGATKIILATVLAFAALSGVATAATNSAPVISGTPPSAGTVGQKYSFRPGSRDANGDLLSFTILNRPSWLNFSYGTGQISGTPTSAGTWSNIQIAVTDGKVRKALPKFNITVKSKSSSAANGAPTISGSPLTSIKAGSAYSFAPTAKDPNGDTLTFGITGKPAWATFSTTSGKLTGTPTAAQVGSYANVKIVVSDGKASAALATFTVNVIPVGSATGSATVSWTPPTENTDGSTLTNLNGYRIYYGTSANAMNQTIQVSGAGMSRYTIDDLSPATYYFAVKAVTSGGGESGFSNTASKKIN